MNVLERQIEWALVQHVKSLGGLCVKQEWANLRGAPDRLVMIPGGIIFMVELKRYGVKPEPHQTRLHNKIRKMGIQVLVIDSIEKAIGILT